MATKRFFMSYQLKSDRDATEAMKNLGVDPEELYGNFVDGPDTMTDQEAVKLIEERDPDIYNVSVEDSIILSENTTIFVPKISSLRSLEN